MDLTQTNHSFYKTSAGGNTRMFSQEGRNRDGKLEDGTRGGLRTSTRGTENIFCESVVEQA